MNKNDSRRMELLVGIFVFMGIVATAYLSLKLGNINIFSQSSYRVYANFSNVSGLKKKAPVTMSGVEIGWIENILLGKGGQARVAIRIKKGVKLSEDCIASIKTMGIIGDKYIAVSQGGMETYLEPEGEITETLPPLDVEDLLGRFIFGNINKGDKGDKKEMLQDKPSGEPVE